jgi:hypothetical protein
LAREKSVKLGFHALAFGRRRLLAVRQQLIIIRLEVSQKGLEVVALKRDHQGQLLEAPSLKRPTQHSPAGGPIDLWRIISQ